MDYPLAFIFTAEELSDTYREPNNYTLLYYSHTEYTLYYSTIIDGEIYQLSSTKLENDLYENDLSYNHLRQILLHDQKECARDHELNLKFQLNHHLNLNTLL